MTDDPASPSSSSTTSKRKKTSRACDACRIGKLKCLYIEKSDPPLCTNCDKAGRTCEAVKPTRIDARRLHQLVERAKTDSDKQRILRDVEQRGVYTAAGASMRKPRPSSIKPATELLHNLQGTKQSDSSMNLLNIPGTAEEPLVMQRNDMAPPLKLSAVEPRMQGATSTISILEDVVDAEAVSAHRKRYGVFHLGSDWVFAGNVDAPMADNSIAMSQMRDDFTEKLLQNYCDTVAPLNPIIPPDKVRETINASYFLQQSVLAVASLDRNIPLEVFLSVRQTYRRSKAELVDSGSTFSQVQALLISSMSHELHGDTNMEGGSMAFLQVGAAIRRAQDLGLHRLNPIHWSGDMYAARGRAWLGCIIADRCYALAYGQPLSVDLLDCEDPLAHQSILQTSDLTHTFQHQIYKLSVMMGKIMQTFFRPNAWARCTDEVILALLTELDTVIEQVPDHISFRGQSTPTQGGLLNLMIVCAEVLFFRAFLRRSSSLPEHITFKPKMARWYTVVQRARVTMSWMNSNGDLLLDCWLFVKVAVSYAALALYLHCIAGEDSESLRSLKTAQEFMHRWSLGHNRSRPVASRAKVADLIGVLFVAAEKATTRHQAESIVTPAKDTSAEVEPAFFFEIGSPRPPFGSDFDSYSSLALGSLEELDLLQSLIPSGQDDADESLF